jgi:hypothetical protein
MPQLQEPAREHGPQLPQTHDDDRNSHRKIFSEQRTSKNEATTEFSDDRVRMSSEKAVNAQFRSFEGVSRCDRSAAQATFQALAAGEVRMSWDIFVQDIPRSVNHIDDMPTDFEPRPLGQRAEVVQRILKVVPSVDFTDPSWGVIEGPDYSVEMNLGDEEEISAITLHVRGGDAAAGLVSELLTQCEWRAFDPESESGIFDPACAAESLKRWRRFHRRASG